MFSMLFLPVHTSPARANVVTRTPKPLACDSRDHPHKRTHLGGEVDVTGRVDEVDKEGRLVDLHVVGLHHTLLGLSGGSGGVSGHLGLLSRLAGALGGLRLQLSAGHLYDTNSTERQGIFDILIYVDG